MLVNQQTYFDKTYDVVVLGFGGAGATAARFAADSGAKVLLVDSAPEGHEGGNTRYSGQVVGYSTDQDEFSQYYRSLAQGLHQDSDVVQTMVDGIINMKEYFSKYLNVEPYSFKADPNNAAVAATGLTNLALWPQFPGSNSYDMLTVHKGFDDGALWSVLREKILERSDKIDVWYSSPGKRLLQGMDGKTIVGVQIEHEHVLRNIKAKNGVVLATGGFENDPQQIQDNLGIKNMPVGGTLYNKGQGLSMTQEVGAKMWHMTAFAPGGMLANLVFPAKKGQRIKPLFYNPQFCNGSIITVGDDGSRYFDETVFSLEGFMYNHGRWIVPPVQDHPHIIFDQNKYDELKKIKDSPFKEAMDHVIKAETPEKLAQLIDADPKVLEETLHDYNYFVKKGKDYQFGRDTKTMAEIGKGPLYAIRMVEPIIFTFGGPKRNGKAEILDAFDKVIPHLYGAGELGANVTDLYQGGQALADCLIFGKIAGQNAGRPKDDYAINRDVEDKIIPAENKNADNLLGSDIKPETYPTKDNQYIGKSTSGMGNEIVVRITVDKKNKLKDIEILKQSESTDYGVKALEQLPAKMISANSYQVDGISGASSTSRGLKEAVKNALDKVQNTDA